MRLMIKHLRNIPLLPSTSLSPGAFYRIKFCISVNPFRESGESEMEGWVDDNVKRGGEGWKEQVLSINDLISFFFSRDKGGSRKSEWFTSTPFTITSLPVRRTARTDGKSLEGEH